MELPTSSSPPRVFPPPFQDSGLQVPDGESRTGPSLDRRRFLKWTASLSAVALLPEGGGSQEVRPIRKEDLAVAHAYQRATGFHLERPPGF